MRGEQVNCRSQGQHVQPLRATGVQIKSSRTMTMRGSQCDHGAMCSYDRTLSLQKRRTP